ncbi:MAG: glucosamine-6-phosphate deaminase, partial [Clostridia bacterium]|nr:glucosamine-6-phosphate deaminase [Clostridia bacterium]
AGFIDVSDVKTVNLDEYWGLEPTHPQSYRYFMNENFFNHINIKPENNHLPNVLGNASNDCAKYDDLIERLGGIDLALLGSGLNGHIGFNEPAESLCARTHVTELTESTIEANSRFFEKKEDVPTKAVTMGMGNLMHAKKIVILITGEEKRPIVQAMIDKKFSVTTQIPATLLKLHPDVTLICDRPAFQKG